MLMRSAALKASRGAELDGFLPLAEERMGRITARVGKKQHLNDHISVKEAETDNSSWSFFHLLPWIAPKSAN
ncbi:hypothetical protein ACFSQ7_02780 [Paenibacillus rhizoplanae]